MKYRVAVGTKDRINITEHFGQCSQFYILDIDQESDSVTFVEERVTSHTLQCGNHNDSSIRSKIDNIQDCHIVLVKQIGGQSEKLLIHNNIIPLTYQGFVSEALDKVRKFYKKQNFIKKE
ncbi:MAG: hypothetical protein K0S41_2128 [Anaerocolumna sp.]|jgi:predicted Fe-Mo cluster-binding NifX family protein|nr:hypothetical protein [Anaerocolumna sp.]